MGVKLTKRQMAIVRHMTRMSEAFSNQLLHIMENHGLDKVEGCGIVIQVCPKYETLTRDITIGDVKSDFGFASVIRGKNEDDWLLRAHSEEYEDILDIEARNAGFGKNDSIGKPVCSDSLWFSDDCHDAPLDCWGNPIRFDDLPKKTEEWDPNDSLS